MARTIYIHIYTKRIRYVLQGIHHGHIRHIRRVGQNRTYTPYTTVYMVISLQKIPYMHRRDMVLANPTYTVYFAGIPSSIQSHTT